LNTKFNCAWNFGGINSSGKMKEELSFSSFHDQNAIFFSVLEFELRSYTMSQPTHHFFCEGFSMIGSHELFDKLALNHVPPNLGLLFFGGIGFWIQVFFLVK
jgi:hypothetical protein